MKRKEILHKMVEISSYLYEKGLVPGKSGNISIRFKNDEHEQIAVTPSGLSLKALDEDDIVIVDMKGNMGFRTDKKPTSELLMHLKIYYNRDDVNAVVHTHSPIATGFSFADEKIERLEGFGPIQFQFIPSIDYYSPGSVELAEAVSKALKKPDAIILKDHGVVALGKNLDEASLLAEFVEESAKTQFIKQILVTNRL
jgi:L-fuculose-phosphate aldolase